MVTAASSITLAGVEQQVIAQVEAHLERVRSNQIKSILLAVENGAAYAAIRDLLPRGVWMHYKQQLAHAGGYSSIKTVERHVRLWEVFGARQDLLDVLNSPETASRVRLSALYDLSRSGTPIEALEIAFHMLEAGETLTAARGAEVATQTATIADVAPDLLGKVKEGQVGLEQAYHLAQAVRAMPQAVATLAVDALVAPDVVVPLYQMYRSDPDEFASLAQAQAIYNPQTQTQVSLTRARPDDFAALLRVNALEARWVYDGTLRGQAGVLLGDLGRRMGAGGEWRLIVYRQEQVEVGVHGNE